MERLTFFTKKYGAGLWDCPKSSCGEICKKNDCKTCPIQKAFDRLAYYEDAEEQGRLFEFPLGMGEKIYEIEEDNTIDEVKIRMLKVNDNGEFFVEGDGKEYRKQFPAIEIGRTLFRTRKEAEGVQKDKNG